MKRLILLLALLSTGAAHAAEPAPHPEAVRNLGDGRLRIGLVTIDPDARTIAFPAKVNMREGSVEYMLVTEQGKTHESVLSTNAQPVNIHAAILLLGVKGSPESRGEKPTDPAERGTIDSEYLETAKLPQGTDVTATVSWEIDGEAKSVALEDLVINEKTKSTAKRGPWLYNGSEMYAGSFVAQGDGSIAALIADSFALVNNPREGYNDDQIWQADSKLLPPVGTPLVVTIFAKKKPNETRESDTNDK